jgi:large subunit ribosomal protein L21
MGIYAVIKTGGKQYRVSPGDRLHVEKLAAVPGDTIEINEVFMIVNGTAVSTGKPTVAGARVVAKVIDEGRHDKIIVFKKKRRKGYRKTMGHRQYYSTLQIDQIIEGDKTYGVQDRDRQPPVPVQKKPEQKPKINSPASAKTVSDNKQTTIEEVAATQTPATTVHKKQETPPASTTSRHLHFDHQEAVDSSPASAEQPTPAAPVKTSKPDMKKEPAPAQHLHFDHPEADTVAGKDEVQGSRSGTDKQSGLEEVTETSRPLAKAKVKTRPTVVPTSAVSNKRKANSKYWIVAILLLLLLGLVRLFSSPDKIEMEQPATVETEALEPLAEEPQAPKPKAAALPKPVIPEVKLQKPSPAASPTAPTAPPE